MKNQTFTASAHSHAHSHAGSHANRRVDHTQQGAAAVRYSRAMLATVALLGLCAAGAHADPHGSTDAAANQPQTQAQAKVQALQAALVAANGPLNAAAVSQIQGLAHNVLSERKKVDPAPELAPLAARVRALQQAAELAKTSSIGSAPNLTLQPATAASGAIAAVASPRSSQSSDRTERLQRIGQAKALLAQAPALSAQAAAHPSAVHIRELEERLSKQLEAGAPMTEVMDLHARVQTQHGFPDAERSALARQSPSISARGMAPPASNHPAAKHPDSRAAL